MVSTFIRHELKAFWRSKNTGKSVAIRVVMALLILYLFLNVLFVGIFLDKLLGEIFANDDLVKSFCGILLIYFLFDLLMRLQLQELPTLRVQPYLHLPIKRNTLVRYLALTAVFSVFNLWPFVLFLPFIFKIIAPDSGFVTALAFIIAIAGLTVFNNYLALYIKRKSNLNGWVFLVSAVVLILITSCDFKWHLYSLHDISYAFFGRLVTFPVLAIVPLVLGIVMYYFNFLYLKQNMYLEELTAHKVKIYKSSTDIPVLARFGAVGDLAANEIKLILRNKRPRSALVMGLFFMFYGLIFYTNSHYGQNWYIFVGMFMTGIFIISYGQFMFSWQASHFDGILVSNISFSDFLKAKYLLFTMVSTVAFLLTTPYAYFGWKIVVVHFVMYLWNIGINTTMVLFFANRNFKRIDLSKGASFNWEGVGATQLLLSFPLILAPYLVYLPFMVFKHPDMGLIALGVIATLFILTRNYWIKQLEADYYSKRYQIAEGFRNK
ncbi:hypothetical protein SAMN05421821_106260 [Mucilaginibacter lappiensis]|uniref:ABC-2 type transport system permease protein n=1 Tax=Mucilaginibacter lappiensis TaxID=354630 RepID=A0ABR6PL18_9SPHI|nr:DUF5687 family protein [Mucilaginibacter lappiensis]MBB6110453.1 hypothetical protein [Mucilaginibacter lappiensis]SIR34614.1 hypothetical protein SAMN05421821_106260 [Mucilaginibacter lappiensis]